MGFGSGTKFNISVTVTCVFENDLNCTDARVSQDVYETLKERKYILNIRIRYYKISKFKRLT